MIYQRIKNGIFANGDCLDIMGSMPDNHFDMIICDLPYGTTQNKWDSVISFSDLWKNYRRICHGPVILTSGQPFTSSLVMSNIDEFKYEWIWKKSKITGVLNAKKQPCRQHESVLVFKNTPIYNPQGLEPFGKTTKQGSSSSNYGARKTDSYVQEFTNYPRSVLEIPSEGKCIHPTQKPVALFQYLIKTYTNEGGRVLDNCAGSGTTAIAAENTGRKWVCIEKDQEYYQKAVERVNNHESTICI